MDQRSIVRQEDLSAFGFLLRRVCDRPLSDILECHEGRFVLPESTTLPRAFLDPRTARGMHRLLVAFVDKTAKCVHPSPDGSCLILNEHELHRILAERSPTGRLLANVELLNEGLGSESGIAILAALYLSKLRSTRIHEADLYARMMAQVIVAGTMSHSIN